MKLPVIGTDLPRAPLALDERPKLGMNNDGVHDLCLRIANDPAERQRFRAHPIEYVDATAVGENHAAWVHHLSGPTSVLPVPQMHCEGVVNVNAALNVNAAVNVNAATHVNLVQITAVAESTYVFALTHFAVGTDNWVFGYQTEARPATDRLSLARAGSLGV